MSLEKKINIRENESIVRIVNRYFLVDWWKYIFGFAFLAAASFWMFQLFSYGYWGYTVYGLLILVGLYIVFRTWFFSRNNIFVVTSERVVDVHRAGWFDVVMSSIGYKDIKDISIRKKGVCANLFNYGTVIIQSKSNRFVLEILKINSPQELQTLLDDLREQYKMDRKLIDVKTIYNNFLKIIPELDDKKLQNISELIAEELEPIEEEDDEDDEDEDDDEREDEVE